MDQRVQEAIGAARVGNEREAQRLLSAVLKDDPEQVQAWFLLSHLVESNQKKEAYLGKVLSLDPGHEQARQRLAWLRSGQTGGAMPEAKTPPAVRIAAAELDVVKQAEGDSLPDWMADDAELVQLVQMETETAVPTPTSPDTPTDLPEWLKESVSNGFLGEEEEPTTSAPTIAPAPKSTMPVKRPQSKTPAPGNKTAVQRWNLLLITFGFLAVIILILLFNALRAL